MNSELDHLSSSLTLEVEQFLVIIRHLSSLCCLINKAISVSLQFCIWMYGLACADEHQTGDRAETVQWSVDTQRRAACKSF